MNDSIRYVTTPGGEELAILPRAQLEELLDVAGHASAMADYRSGRVEALSTSEMRELMKAPTPLAFWRRRRGVTQAALAGLAETTQPHIAELESGKRGGSLDVMARIGRALKVPLEALACGGCGKLSPLVPFAYDRKIIGPDRPTARSVRPLNQPARPIAFAHDRKIT